MRHGRWGGRTTEVDALAWAHCLSRGEVCDSLLNASSSKQRTFEPLTVWRRDRAESRTKLFDEYCAEPA